ncbi:HalX domain-containing protein [Halostagnicola sp. A56]|uniref:HalX domain-containing protein n=1 Tax=Halostagnicola sp. A56 TaxID=1495067 RepID=UPI0009E6497E
MLVEPLVENLISLPSYADAVQQYFQLSAKKAALESNKSQAELESTEEYTKLLEKHAKAKARADTRVESISDEVPFAALEDRSYFS